MIKTQINKACYLIISHYGMEIHVTIEMLHYKYQTNKDTFIKINILRKIYNKQQYNFGLKLTTGLMITL